MRLKRKVMQGNVKRCLKLGGGIILLLFVSFFFVNCTAYNPSLFPTYDPLSPGKEVKINPLGFVVFDATLEHYIIVWDTDIILSSDENYAIVNQAFMIHYRELWDEIIKLRKMLK